VFTNNENATSSSGAVDIFDSRIFRKYLSAVGGATLICRAVIYYPVQQKSSALLFTLYTFSKKVADLALLKCFCMAAFENADLEPNIDIGTSS
jgi:hypothetical protein